MARPVHGDETARWIADFHSGRRSTLEECYRAHFVDVLAAARRVLPRVDAETVAHEVFCRLLADAKMRSAFQGGNLGAWLAKIATNQALDHRRRAQRETGHRHDDVEDQRSGEMDQRLAAHELVQRFRHEVLPSKWDAVFEARLLRQLGQGEAARELGMSRTTLMYQEHRIRVLLRRFLLREDPP
jgi:RNA polymerase sigma-70 factor (ECF subfamily)